MGGKKNFVLYKAVDKIWATEYQQSNKDKDKAMCKLYSIHGDTPLREILNGRDLWFFFGGEENYHLLLNFLYFMRVEYFLDYKLYLSYRTFTRYAFRL